MAMACFYILWLIVNWLFQYFKKNNLSTCRCLLRQNLRRTQPSDSALAWMRRLDLPVDPFSSKSQIVLVSSTRKNNSVMLRQSWTTINCTYLVAGHPDPREDGHSACSNNRLLLSPCWWSLHAGKVFVLVFINVLLFTSVLITQKRKRKENTEKGMRLFWKYYLLLLLIQADVSKFQISWSNLSSVRDGSRVPTCCPTFTPWGWSTATTCSCSLVVSFVFQIISFKMNIVAMWSKEPKR